MKYYINGCKVEVKDYGHMGYTLFVHSKNGVLVGSISNGTYGQAQRLLNKYARAKKTIDQWVNSDSPAYPVPYWSICTQSLKWAEK